MSLDASNVMHIAKLARIQLQDGEAERYANELSSILDWVEQLSEVKEDDTNAVSSVTRHDLPMREDSVTDGDKVNDILHNAPQSDYGCFVVPKVIDQG